MSCLTRLILISVATTGLLRQTTYRVMFITSYSETDDIPGIVYFSDLSIPTYLYF